MTIYDQFPNSVSHKNQSTRRNNGECTNCVTINNETKHAPSLRELNNFNLIRTRHSQSMRNLIYQYTILFLFRNSCQTTTVCTNCSCSLVSLVALAHLSKRHTHTQSANRPLLLSLLDFEGDDGWILTVLVHWHIRFYSEEWPPICEIARVQTWIPREEDNRNSKLDFYLIRLH